MSLILDVNEGDDDLYHNFILQQFNLSDNYRGFNKSMPEDLTSFRNEKKRAKTTAMPFGFTRGYGEKNCEVKTRISCSEIVGDFRFLQAFKRLIFESSMEMAKEQKIGTLLKMLLTQVERDETLQRAVFNHYVDRDRFGSLYSDKWLNPETRKEAENVALHELVLMLAKRDHHYERQRTFPARDQVINSN